MSIAVVAVCVASWGTLVVEGVRRSTPNVDAVVDHAKKGCAWVNLAILEDFSWNRKN